MRTIRLPVAEWTPDLPESAGSAVVKNVYPKTPLSYGPVRSPAPIYGPLDDRCLGAAAYLAENGVVSLFAGSTNKLYEISTNDPTWVDRSNPSTAYMPTSRWRFVVFNGDVIAASRDIPPQKNNLLFGADNFADLGGNPPYGRFIAVVKNAFVLLGDTYEPSDGSSHNDRLHWCAVGNHNDWPIPGTTDAAAKEAGSVRLHGPAGQIMGLASNLASADAIVFQRFGVQRMIYTGPPTTFSVLPVESARGCIAPDSIVVYGGIAYYWGEDGIYAFDGLQSKPIGANKVDKTVYDEFDLANADRVVGVADPRNHLIIWAYPTSGGSVDGNPDRLLIYNWSVDRWSFADVTCETLVRLLTVGYTLSELETVLGYEELRDVPYPLTSRVWLGGITSMGIFDTDHRLSFMEAAPLEAIVDTPEMQATPGARQLVTGVRPLVDGFDVAPTVSIGRRETMQADVSWTTPAAMNALGVCPVRASGRYVRGRLTVPSTESWSAISGVEVDVVQQGRR